ncbi:MAG: GNAT family N-acetyltransferase [Candidatus Izimaplasma sp.]|nr:GNAT family N-acetyltransferase [Candidatus Izimaplasma bacterium]
MGVTLLYKVNGIPAATVATTAETTQNAMVVAVATKKEFRNQGLASQLMTHLMHHYFTIKNKHLCLFFDNPDAGKIYKRLGFKDLGTWIMAGKK